MNKPVPLRPDYSALRHQGVQTFIRATAAALRAFVNKTDIRNELRNWPQDRSVETIARAAMASSDNAAAEIITKAATSPASTVGSGWADTLGATSAVSDFIGALGPVSAGSALLRRGLVLQFNNKIGIRVPTIVAGAGTAKFVKEADPIPAQQFSFSGPILSPRKFATLPGPFTREIFSYSLPTIESLIRAALTESVGLALDAALFSNTAGDATRPPGLMVGISALTPSANTDHDQACTEDTVKLAASVLAVAGNGEVVFIVSPNQFERLHQRFGFPYPVLNSSALPDKTVICVAANCIASATDPAPRFDISDQGAEHLDTAPLPIGQPGNVVASVTVSLYQSDLISLRMIFELGWVLRHASGLAWMQNVVW